jgi:hypothetical protein
VVCGVAFCTEGAVTNEPKCNSAATCVIPPSVSCDPYQCNPAGSACSTTCDLDTDCATGLVCINGSCAQPIPDGGGVVPDAGRPDASTGEGGSAGTAGSAGGSVGTAGTPGAGGSSAGSTGAGGSRPGGSAGTSVDAGVSTGPDAGKKPGAEGHDDGGCGCRVQGSSGSDARGIAGLLAGLLVLAGRRRRSSRAGLPR